MYKRAFVSVSNKTGLEDFLKPLVKEGMELVSTGGTSRFLRSKGFKVIDVEDVTGFPEVFSGRVKTLHPKIHMSLLSRDWLVEDRKLLDKYGLKAFDLVVGHLYPFEEKTQLDLKDEELVEWIDVGGPSFLRSAAKNYFRITTVCDFEDYPLVQKGTHLEQRKHLAIKVFETLSRYDALIAHRLRRSPLKKTKTLDIKLNFFKPLRYGENPHQKADWYQQAEGLHCAELLQGKPLSYNNVMDFSSAVLALREFSPDSSAVAVKHNNPCGVAIASDIFTAVQKSLKADPLSVFGGVLALSHPMDKDSAGLIESLFLEGLIAPDFSSKALAVLKKKKNLRILKWADMLSCPLAEKTFSDVLGGVLIQTRDRIQKTDPKLWKIIGPQPSEKIIKDLLFSLRVCTHLKSNAIVVVKDGQTLGLGMGQVNRVDAVRLALQRVQSFHPKQNKDLILASDAFFPFIDSIEFIAQSGVSWILQPGGSIKDEEVCQKVQELGMSMVLTGERHFKH